MTPAPPLPDLPLADFEAQNLPAVGEFLARLRELNVKSFRWPCSVEFFPVTEAQGATVGKKAKRKAGPWHDDEADEP